MAQDSKIRVFLDTNVMFSGLYSPNRAPGVILQHFSKGEIIIVVSPLVLDELVRTMRAKLPLKLPVLLTLLTNSPPEIQDDPSIDQVKKLSANLDFADAAILAAAISAKVDYFITGDKHFLAKSDVVRESSLIIVTPAEFVKLTERQMGNK